MRLPVGVTEDDLASQRPLAHFEATVERDQLGGFQVERFVIHVELDDLAVRTVEHGLPGLGEAVRVLAVDDRPVLVEAVEIRAGFADRAIFFVVAAHAEIPVRQGESGLARADQLRRQPTIEAVDLQAPRVDREEVAGWIEAFAQHSLDPLNR